MTSMTPIELKAWIATYVAMFVLCGIAFALSVAVALTTAARDRVWLDVRGVKGAVLFLPKLWWRWQKVYITAAPVTLGIVFWYASTLRW